MTGPEHQSDPNGAGGPWTPPGPPPYGPPPYGSPPYGPPPGASYGGPPPPYGPGPYPPGGPGITSPDDTTWALAGYLGQFAAGLIAPLVVYLARKDQSPFVRFHGAQALNAGISYLIFILGAMAVAVACGLSRFPVGAILAFVSIFVFAIVHVVYLIVGAVKAGRREMYRIPAWLCWRMVR